MHCFDPICLFLLRATHMSKWPENWSGSHAINFLSCKLFSEFFELFCDFFLTRCGWAWAPKHCTLWLSDTVLYSLKKPPRLQLIFENASICPVVFQSWDLDFSLRCHETHATCAINLRCNSYALCLTKLSRKSALNETRNPCEINSTCSRISSKVPE